MGPRQIPAVIVRTWLDFGGPVPSGIDIHVRVRVVDR